MEQETQVLHYCLATGEKKVKIDVSLLHNPETHKVSLKIEQQPKKTGTSRLIAEIKAPFDYKYWWKTHKSDRSFIDSKRYIMLNLLVRTKEAVYCFFEKREDISTPYGWTFEKTDALATHFFEVTNLAELLQKIKGTKGIEQVYADVESEIGQNVQELTRRMKLKNAPPYAMFNKAKKTVNLDEVNGLPRKERDIVAEQLLILAKNMAYQFKSTEIAMKTINLAKKINNISSVLAASLSETKEKLAKLAQEYEEVAKAQEARQKKVERGNVWYYIVGVMGFILYILSEFVLD